MCILCFWWIRIVPWRICQPSLMLCSYRFQSCQRLVAYLVADPRGTVCHELSIATFLSAIWLSRLNTFARRAFSQSYALCRGWKIAHLTSVWGFWAASDPNAPCKSTSKSDSQSCRYCGGLQRTLHKWKPQSSSPNTLTGFSCSRHNMRWINSQLLSFWATLLILLIEFVVHSKAFLRVLGPFWVINLRLHKELGQLVVEARILQQVKSEHSAEILVAPKVED